MMRQKFLTIHVKEVHLEFLLFYILQRCNKFCSRSELRITPKKFTIILIITYPRVIFY